MRLSRRATINDVLGLARLSKNVTTQTYVLRARKTSDLRSLHNLRNPVVRTLVHMGKISNFVRKTVQTVGHEKESTIVPSLTLKGKGRIAKILGTMLGKDKGLEDQSLDRKDNAETILLVLQHVPMPVRLQVDQARQTLRNQTSVPDGLAVGVDAGSCWFQLNPSIVYQSPLPLGEG